ncbi:alanyl-tRNA editing protein Aarsd1 [Macrosteles quadrilineatus]|uniref:alanyl-tRNA editing protein Aarsd1 n=1 Tax=Macrosteles quadrilineatus TaxID=74068 RepID=UPI0023E0F89E|nr:alanyl-tRNA editing protein Aarsd1 [Macrosteles quadrilineatus]
MILKCQEDSFLKEFTTKLVECIEDEFSISISAGTQIKIKGVGIILENTILFPEGGGQPCDEGVLRLEREGGTDELRVCHVFRRNGQVVHLVEERWDVPWNELLPGTPVHQLLSWHRRFYHMIQHSGQHLISALAERMFQLDTLSWCLGSESCYIELEQITEDQYKTLEIEANTFIGKDLRVSAHVYKEGDQELQKAKTRGLPEGHVGDVRVIEIENLDKNMCCGTHVSSLRQLEVIKFLGTGKKVFKKKKTCLLYFVVGRDKVFQKFDCMHKKEESISTILNKLPEEHVTSITDMKEGLAVAKKTVKELQKEVVMLIINAFKEEEPNPALFCLHRPDGDLELMNFISRQFKGMNVVLFLSIGEEEGNVLLEGPKDIITELAPKVSSVLIGKGVVSGNKFQAKVSRLSCKKRVEDLIREALTVQCRSA